MTHNNIFNKNINKFKQIN